VTAGLLALGVSHKTAPLELRERLSLPEGRAAGVLRELRTHSAVQEAVAISTCNRTELYFVTSDTVGAENEALGVLSRQGEIRPTELMGHVYSLRDAEAVRHLFEVAAGLDSMIVGEAEVQGQVKRAYELALVEGVTGPISNRLFRDALGAGKRVRTETAIGESPASVSSAAAALAAQVFGDLTGRRVLLVGAGRIGELAASNLVSRGAEIAFVANRTVETARELAHRFGGAAIGLDELGAKLGEVDVVLSSTSSPDAVVRAADVPVRRRAPLFFIDIAVPRNVEPAVNDLENAFCYDIDDLRAVVEANLKERQREALRAQTLLEGEVVKFATRLQQLEVVPTIVSLREKLEAIRRAELERALGRLPGAGEETRRVMEALSQAIVNKVLHAPLVKLKDSSRAGHARRWTEMISELFGLRGPGRPGSRE
jgi:glutamyl-tRNA reductase